MHGPSGWALLYQADVRCRQEWMDSIRTRLLLAHTTAIALHQPTTFRADKPWDSVWEAAIQDDKFWKREFERPAGKLDKFLMGVEGDAPIQGQRGASSHSPPQQQQQRQQQQPPRQQQQQQRQQPPQRPAYGSQPASWRTHNDRDEELCRGFQDGSCNIGQGHSGQCGRDKRHRHQCAICLSSRHGATRCGPDKGGKKGGKKEGYKESRGGKKRKGGN